MGSGIPHRTGKVDINLILLHGAYLTHQMWAPQIAPLQSAGFKVFAPDLRWHGIEPVHHEPFTNEACVADMFVLLDQNGLDKVVICGYAMGGTRTKDRSLPRDLARANFI